MNPSVETLRQQLRQLQALHDSGELSAEALAQARAPLEQQLVAAVLAAQPAGEASAAVPVAAAAPRPSRGLVLSLAGAVLALAVAGYSLTGAPGLMDVSPSRPMLVDAGNAAGSGEPPVTEAQVSEIMERMAARLREQPDDAPGWMLLARAYAAMGRFSEAVPAFQQALRLVGDDADLLADYADTLAAQASGQFTAEAEDLVARALALQPGNIKALALSGSIAFDRRDYATAVRQWERVAAGLPSDNPMRDQVLASVMQARQLGGIPPGPVPLPLPPVAAVVPAAPAGLPPGATPAEPPGGNAGAGGNGAAPAAGAVHGRVSLAPALAARADPEATVFILARPAGGPRMPLAVLRRQVKDLPLEFTLDDSLAMAPGALLSQQAQVVVTARVSVSGDAISQPGDLIGQSQPVAPGTRGLVIEIGEVVAAPR
jgi:cytochrome c-type biogenesis protein CcmH